MGHALAPAAEPAISAPRQVSPRLLAPAGWRLGKESGITPESGLLLLDNSSRVEISVRCEYLPRRLPVMLVGYTKWCSEGARWVECGKTEVNGTNARFPVFLKTFDIDFRLDMQRLLRVELYYVRAEECPQELARQKFLGSAEVLLNDVMMARGKQDGNGWYYKNLTTYKQKDKDIPQGRVALFAEEAENSKREVVFKLRAEGLPWTDMWKRKVDPYFILNRTKTLSEEGELGWEPVYRSEVARHTSNPEWKFLKLSVNQICNCNSDQDIIFEIWDWFRVSRKRYIGDVCCNFRNFMEAATFGKPIFMPIYQRKGVIRAGGRTVKRPPKQALRAQLPAASEEEDNDFEPKSPGKKSETTRSEATLLDQLANLDRAGSGSVSGGGQDEKLDRTTLGRVVGQFILQDVRLLRRYSFLDFIRGGLEIRMAVAIDFTRSNKGPEHPDSYHCLDSENESSYTTVIRAVGDVMRSFDNDGHFPAYGFGAKIPPSKTVCSDCFALNGDFFDPEVKGVEGILKAYKQALRVVSFHGPTRLAEVIRLTSNFAAPYAKDPDPNGPPLELKYFVLLILTDGIIDDQMAVVNEVLQACNLPMSLVVVGMGHEDFSFLTDLADGVGDLLKAKEQEDPHSTAADLPGDDAGAGHLPDPFAGRDLVHFVKYEDFRGRPTELASTALQEVPREVVAYFTKRNIKPGNLDKREDKAGKALDKFAAVTVKDMRKIGLGGVDANANANRGKTKDKIESRLPSKQESKEATEEDDPESALMNADVALDGPEESRTASKSSSKDDADDGTRSKSKLRKLRARGIINDVPPEEVQVLTAEELEKKRIASLPPFLAEEKRRLWERAATLGYEGFKIKRAFADGVAAGTIEALLDNLMNSGYGKLPSYREAVVRAPVDDYYEDVGARLPGVVPEAFAMSRSVLTAPPGRSAPRSAEKAKEEKPKEEMRSKEKEDALDLNLLSLRLSLIAGNQRASSKLHESLSKGAAPATPTSAGTDAARIGSKPSEEESRRRSVRLSVQEADSGPEKGSRKSSKLRKTGTKDFAEETSRRRSVRLSVGNDDGSSKAEVGASRTARGTEASERRGSSSLRDAAQASDI